jgi:hypothetical protein
LAPLAFEIARCRSRHWRINNRTRDQAASAP